MDKSIARAFQQRPLAIAASLFLVLIVGVADYLSGYEISLSIFYLFAISVAIWNVGPVFAVFISALSVTSWLVGDWAAGVVYPNRFVPVWNAAIIFAFYLFVVWLLSRLKSLNQTLESRIKHRTAALAAEIEERQRLEKEILTISEREQQRIGHDLHDSLCQHLTGTALAGQVLGEKLATRSLPEVADANHLVELVEQGITIARNLARGLFPVEIEAEGLISALRELAVSNTQRAGIICQFEGGRPALIYNSFAGTHLYRIAQEAVRNAIKHSGARNIIISFNETGQGAELIVRDDGNGFTSPRGTGKGMGLDIMRHRATMIGATFDIRSDSHGTVVLCSIAENAAS